MASLRSSSVSSLSAVAPLLLAALTSFLLLPPCQAAECGSQANNRLCPDPNECCSQFGFCDIGESWCGKGCQNGPCYTTPSPTPRPTVPVPVMDMIQPPETAKAIHDDSRLIAYVGNWQPCPTVAQTDGYTHIVVAFAVTYQFNSYGGNICDEQCNIIDATSGTPINSINGEQVKVCNEQSSQDLVNSWKNSGKKVILSFGGAGMGGSWSGDQNNCWDYCFGKEEQLSTALVNIVQRQNFDGIDIDYEYCYDKLGGNRHSGCWQTSSELYSDDKAQAFLSKLTAQLRWKLDMLGSGYELTHAPMDVDLEVDSPYYRLLKEQAGNLDFLMPQFYNGITRPASTDGFTGRGVGKTSTSIVYGNLVNDMFGGQPEKVVFGFCISDCGGSGSNANGNEAVSVLQQVKAYNNGEFSCNGGAFFWVAFTDAGGTWSDLVWDEVKKTSGCSTSRTNNIIEVVPIKFEVKGLPNVEQEKEVIEIEMRTLFSRILMGLEERVDGLKILGVEENKAANDVDWLRMGEATLYYYVNVARENDGRDSGSIFIQELRNSHDAILDEVSFSDLMYIGKDLGYNWCANTDLGKYTQSGPYSHCVHENFDELPASQPAMQPGTQSATPPGTQPVLPPEQSALIQSEANLQGDGGMPGWSIALIVLLCFLILGGIGFFAFKRRKQETSKETQSNIYTVAIEDDSSQTRSHRTKRVKDRAKDQVAVDEKQHSVTSGWSKAPDSIEHASYGSKRVDGTNRISRDPSLYLAGREEEPMGYLHGQENKPDPETASICRTKAKQDPDSVSIRSARGHARNHRHSSEEPPSKPQIDP